MEKGLSPRRAQKRSLLPLSPRRTQVRPRPLPVSMCLAIARCTSAPAEASPAQEYRLRLKVAGAHSLAKPPGARLFKSSTRLSRVRGSCPSRPSSAALQLALRFSVQKICPAYFFDRNRTSKNSGSSQSLASFAAADRTN